MIDMLRAGRKSVLLFQNIRSGPGVRRSTRLFSEDSCKPKTTPPSESLKTSLPPKPNKSRALQTFLAAGGSLLVVVFGSTVAYAKYDESGSFRRKVESNVPGSSSLFDLVLGSSKPAVSDAMDRPLYPRKFDRTSGSVKISEGSSVFVSRDAEPVNKGQNTVQLSCQKDDEPSSHAFSDSSVLSMKNSHPGIASLATQPVSNEIDSEELAQKLMSQGEPSETPDVKHTEDAVLQTENQVGIPDAANELSIKNTTNQIESGNILNVMEEECSCEKEEQKKPPRSITPDEQLEFDASSSILDDILSSTSVACANAIVLNHAAAKALAIHSSLLRTALDDTRANPNEKSLQWGDVALSLSEKEKKLNAADVCFDKARQEITKLKKALESMNVDNSLIKQKVNEVEASFNNLSHDLNDSLRKVDNQKVAAKALFDYQSSIENTKSNLQSELNLPEGKKVEEWKRQGVQLSCREDIDALRQMNDEMRELKERLEEERTASAARIQEAIDEVRAATIAKLRREYEEEMKRMLGEGKKVHQIAASSSTEYSNVDSHTIKLDEAQCEFESKMEEELKKQASNHAEHLAEALTYLDTQAKHKYQVALKKEIDCQREEFERGLEEEKMKFEVQTRELQEQHQVDLNSALAKLKGIKSVVDGRAHTEQEVRKALELSLACESLLVSLKYGNHGEPLPLKSHIETIKDVYGDHPAIVTLSSSLHSNAQDRGAYPEETIRRKLHDTMQTCKRVSLVDENRNSLFVYFLSYLKSFLIISRPSTQPPEHIEPSDLDCFTIISYATYCLQRGDIEQAVRFLNQLKGEARLRAEGWLKEARLYLETKQSVDALCAISDSIVIGAQLEK